MKKYLILLTVGLIAGCPKYQFIRKLSRIQMQSQIKTWEEHGGYTSDTAGGLKIMQYALKNNISATEAVDHFCGKSTGQNEQIDTKLTGQIGNKNSINNNSRGMPNRPVNDTPRKGQFISQNKKKNKKKQKKNK